MQTIQLKRGALADLIALNPIPEPGEIILDTDSGNFKIGDGVRDWSTLPYANMSLSSLRAAAISDFNAAATTAAVAAFGGQLLRNLFDVDKTLPNNGDLLVSTSGFWAVTAPAAVMPSMWVDPPVTSNSTGVPGQIARDANYFYVCAAANTWLRAPLSSW